MADQSTTSSENDNNKTTTTTTTTSSSSSSKNLCPICQKPATSRCSRCKSIWYCCVDHQRQHWKVHKPVCTDTFKADQLTLHKQEFDRIVKQYKLDSEEKSEQIAEFLTNNNNSDNNKNVSAPEFAEKFGMKMEEAVVFLEWIKVGVKFREETMDAAKKSGISTTTTATKSS